MNKEDKRHASLRNRHNGVTVGFPLDQLKLDLIDIWERRRNITEMNEFVDDWEARHGLLGHKRDDLIREITGR